MGLLDQLWDDTVAGPQPENGLGKLRKHPTFTKGKELDSRTGKSYSEEISEEAAKVTRKIMIIKPPTAANESPPISPAGSTPPVSPFSAGLGGDLRQMFMRDEGAFDPGDLLLLTTCEM
ncbi:hypothetical protein AQUCO_01700159v1 [Aquilegia coerulea]|uniref:Uncharacterized protein n=1 Tax=Aquilegia coerulea TaxID=218851 RepID=A0A2G5DLK8_AQUCA|nr:hypothetical protein AQUCO_01700159v1 [Aquilegia coerulea]